MTNTVDRRLFPRSFVPILSVAGYQADFFLLQSAQDLKGAIRPYALTDHIHEREASYRLSQLFSQPLNSPFQLAFVPNVAPWFSGIISVLSAPLKQSMRADEVWKLYEEKYANEPLVKIQRSVPDVTEAEGKHGWRVGGVQVHSSGKRVVVVVSLCEMTSKVDG